MNILNDPRQPSTSTYDEIIASERREEALQDAYAVGRGDQFEDDCAVVRLLFENLNDADAMGDGRINTTRVRELLSPLRRRDASLRCPDGYGPQNLMHRLEEGIPSEYGYTAGAFAALKARSEWQPIETAPNMPDKTMFVVRAFNVPTGGGLSYTSDPWCVWILDNGDFARWPHKFPPTHWTPLPPAPAEHGTEGSESHRPGQGSRHDRPCTT